MYKFLLTNRRIILFTIIVGIIAGMFSLQKLPIKLYPDIEKPVIAINFSHPSYTAVDFRDTYGTIIENAANSIEGMQNVETTISNGRTSMRLDFEYGLSAEEVRKKVQSTFDAIKNSLPEESKDFYINYWSQTLNELDIALFSTEVDEKTLYEIAKPIILEHLSKIPDAETVDIMQVEQLRASLILKPDALFSYNMTVDSVISAIRSGYKNISVGSLRTPSGQVSLRIKKDIDTLFDVSDIIIGTVGGKTIQLKDVADVNISYGLPYQSYRVNARRSVMIYIQPAINGNLSALSSDVHKALDAALKELPDHISYEVVLDPATFINRSVENVINSALIGALLAFACILLLIGEFKNTLIIAISIPLSVILSFILMFAFKVSINLISLSGLALAVGMIVDASIVVMENIYRHRENQLRKHGGKIANYIKLIAKSTKEVVPSIVGSTITSVCVFVPLSFTSALTASILGDLAWTVVFTLSCSLLVALFVIPLIAFYVFRTKKVIQITKIPVMKRFSTALITHFESGYENILKMFLHSKWKSIVFITASAALLAFCVIFLAPKITREIIAVPQSNILAVNVYHNTIRDQDELLQAILPLENDLLTNYPKMVKTVFSIVMQNSAGFIVTLDKASSVPKMIDTLMKKYQDDSTWSYYFESWDPSAMPLPETWDLHIRVEGPSRTEIFALEDHISDIINKSELYAGIRMTPSTSLSSEIAMYPRNETFDAIGDYSPSRITSQIQYLLNGANVLTIKADDREMTLQLRYPQNTVTTLKDIQDFQLPYNGKSIPIKHFFDFQETTGINQLFIVNGKETYNIYANMPLSTPEWKRSEYEKTIKTRIAEEIQLPSGYRIIFEDTQKVINEAISSLFGAIALSIVLIYIVLGIQFNSTRIPLIILLTIPFGFIGVILSLFVFKSTISLNSMLGIILLGGIVVNNAIIIIDFYSTARKKFDSRIDAILYAVRLRFRPIIITTMTTILGMLPIAFAIGDGANIIQPLGIAVSGGLAFSTFFTLFMIPIILNFFGMEKKDADEKVKKIKGPNL